MSKNIILEDTQNMSNRSLDIDEVIYMDYLKESNPRNPTEVAETYRLFLRGGVAIGVTETDYLKILAIRHPNEKGQGKRNEEEVKGAGLALYSQR